MALSSRFLTLRRSPLLLHLPPYLSLLSILIGITWLLLLPLDAYSRSTYISENAILPGQVFTYYGGSEHNIFRALRQEVYTLSQYSPEDRIDALQDIIKDFGLKAARQAYTFRVAGEEIRGTNVYGILQGPRADATEAMVLMAAWRSVDGQINYSGVALALSLARYFQRWSIWSKDIILLIPEDGIYGSEAWVSAYHSTASLPTYARNVSALPIKSGALQAAVALDYPAGPWGQRFERLDVLYDGINGALPNLDLLNTAVNIAHGQMGIECALHGMEGGHADAYRDRLECIGRGIASQALGHATGPHSAFVPYHVDAITLRTVGEGWHDEMSLGRVAESTFRSINNLLEHLHQSFFFYILMGKLRFVSIGSYLPAAMILAGGFTVNALALWVLSGRGPVERVDGRSTGSGGEGREKVAVSVGGKDAVVVVPKAELESVERKLALPAITVLAVHLLSSIPLYLTTSLHQKHHLPTFYLLTASTYALPLLTSLLLTRIFSATSQQLQTLQSFSLLFLGAVLSTWATINFSLAFVIGLLASPLPFARPFSTSTSTSSTSSPSSSLKPSSTTKTNQNEKDTFNPLPLIASLSSLAVYLIASPPAAVMALAWFSGKGLQGVLLEVAKGWVAQGVWTSLVVWCVWWPGWVLGGVVLWSGIVRA